MSIAVAMLLASFSRLFSKVWGDDVIDKALTIVVCWALDKWATMTPNKRDDEFVAFIKSKLESTDSQDTGLLDE